MKLSELEPRWIHANVFVFLCPHCKKVLLTCKNIVMSSREQYDLFEKTFGEEWNQLVVPSRESFAWTIHGINRDNFDQLTVTPSIDASASGHWHGLIRNGQIT